jgi:vacuolar-type H+-ATPase subunit I/STV1
MPQIERQPRWVGIPGRVFAFAFLSTLLSFAVALLISILGTIIYSQIEHVAPNLVFAYKHIAFPVALLAGAVVLMVSLVLEIRNYRQNKILAAIERTAAMNR